MNCVSWVLHLGVASPADSHLHVWPRGYAWDATIHGRGYCALPGSCLAHKWLMITSSPA